MKICIAQTRSIKGNISKNIENHLKLINSAIEKNAEMIIFPELSLTSYEPTLAKDLAINLNAERLNIFQEISNTEKIIIGVGIPTINKRGICISMIIFQPHKKRILNSKKHLHPDENDFFVSGDNAKTLTIGENKVSFAICYELSIAQHSENAFRNSANIYLTSVAKSANGVTKASESLSEIAKKYSMITLMSNCVGFCDNFESAGKSAIWNKKGEIMAQMDEKNEGILIIDTENEVII